MIPEIKVTTELLWRATLIFALIDAVFVPFLAWRIKPEKLRQMKWTLAATMVIFWSALWTWVFYNFWEEVYHYFFPEWARWLLPPVYGLLFATVGLLFWWLALRLPGNAVANFCLLGGSWGMITHRSPWPGREATGPARRRPRGGGCYRRLRVHVLLVHCAEYRLAAATRSSRNKKCVAETSVIDVGIDDMKTNFL